MSSWPAEAFGGLAEVVLNLLHASAKLVAFRILGSELVFKDFLLLRQIAAKCLHTKMGIKLLYMLDSRRVLVGTPST